MAKFKSAIRFAKEHGIHINWVKHDQFKDCLHKVTGTSLLYSKSITIKYSSATTYFSINLVLWHELGHYLDSRQIAGEDVYKYGCLYTGNMIKYESRASRKAVKLSAYVKKVIKVVDFYTDFLDTYYKCLGISKACSVTGKYRKQLVNTIR